MRKGEHFSFTEGWQNWDYLYSRDAGEALCLIGRQNTGTRIYCLGSGESRPLREYILKMKDVINPSAEVGLGEIPYEEGAVMNLCADISELQRDTGWKPVVKFEEGLAELGG